MTHRTQCFPNVSFLYTYIFYSFQFSDAFLLSLSTQFTVYNICSIFYVFATSFSASLFLQKSHWHGFFVFLRHRYDFFFFKSAAYPFFNTFFLTIYSISSSGLYVVSVQLNYVLWYAPFFLYLYNLCFHFTISHLSLFHWQFCLISQKMHGQTSHIFPLRHESRLLTIWLNL